MRKKGQNRYRGLDFVRLPLKFGPAQTICTILYRILDGLLPAYQTLATASFIDTAIGIFEGKKEPSAIFVPILLIVGFILFYNLTPSVAAMVELSGRNRLTVGLKSLLLDKRSALEYCHIENAKTQDLIGRVCDEPVKKFSDGFNAILEAVKLIVSSVSLLCIIIASAPLAGVLITVVSIPLFVLASKTGQKTYEMSKETQRVKRDYTYLSEVLTGREYSNERNLFGYSDVLRKKYGELFDQARKVERKIEIKTYVNMKSGSMVTLLVIIGIISALLPSLARNEMTIGLFMALVNAVMGLVQSMSWRLADAMMQLSRMREYLKDFNDFFALSEKRDAGKTAERPRDFEFKTLEFRNVTFRYPGTEHDILHDCSFVLENGKSYALVGANGAGKSTLTKLITGMYDEYKGEILLNGKDIRTYDYAVLKTLVSVVFQDFMRYQLSLKDNLLLGSSGQPDEKKMRGTIEQIGLEGITDKLTAGLDTPLGKLEENGVDLSGGEWQRVAIARMLYTGAPINILDEPTAALDPIAESRVYEMFGKLNGDRFNLYITHRLGAAKIMDEILVLDGGRIAEQGSHEQLVGLENGIYREQNFVPLPQS